EYTSAAVFARMVHWMIQVGMPAELLTKGLQVVQEELDHARLSDEVRVTLGGKDEPIPLDVRSLNPSEAPEGVVASLVDATVHHLCLGETLAVPLFAAMRERTTHPAVVPLLTRILSDEAGHGRWGWGVLDVLLEIDGPGVRDRVSRRLPDDLVAFSLAYGQPRPSEPLTARELACGMIPPTLYATLHDATIRDTILPRFAQRDIQPTRHGRTAAPVGTPDAGLIA
ncbi:MAG: hypothetical protein ACI9MC_003592, partial [Kiritimatiellia bacterium]